MIGSAMFGATFNLAGYTCRSAVMFGTLKDDSLCNILASNNCFSHRNVFQNGANTLSKIVNHFFEKNRTKFCMARTIQFCSHFTSMWSKYYGETSDFNVSISNGNIKFPIGKSIFVVNLPLKLFRATIKLLILTLEV